MVCEDAINITDLFENKQIKKAIFDTSKNQRHNKQDLVNGVFKVVKPKKKQITKKIINISIYK